MITGNDLQEMVNAYMECARWSSSDGDYDILDEFEFAEGEEIEAMKDCKAFVDNNISLVKEYMQSNTFEQLGHDLWLTRNEHGAGFWDRDLGGLGEELTVAAEWIGHKDVFVNDEKELEFL